MLRPLTLIGAPSNIGISPYDDGTPRRLSEAPQALREAGRRGARCNRRRQRDARAVSRLRATVNRRPQPAGGAAVSDALAARVTATLATGAFPIVLGGDCSVVLGCLLGARRAGSRPIGLAYLMPMPILAPWRNRAPARPRACASRLRWGVATRCSRVWPAHRSSLIGMWRWWDAGTTMSRVRSRRTGGVVYRRPAGHVLRRRPLDAIVSKGLEQAAGPEVEGFWLHLDADLLSPAIMPAVDSPIEGGPLFEEAIALLAPLVQHPKALGFELTIYDPSLDPTREAARTLVGLLARAFQGPNSGSE